MKTSILRGLMILAAAGTVSAGCGDGPALSAPPDASLDTGTPLSVGVSCTSTYGTTYDCTATATGGSGTGYSFRWAYGGEYYDQGGVSKAYVTCYKYSGSYHGTLSNYGSVTDSDGNTAWFSVSRSC